MQNGGFRRRLWAALLALTLGLCGCAGLQEAVEPSDAAGGKKAVAMTSRSFRFEPNHIRAVRGDSLALEVENLSRMTHNITVTDPQGHVVAGADLPGKSHVQLDVRLDQAGEYRFYCDKLLHPSLGMKGVIEVR